MISTCQLSSKNIFVNGEKINIPEDNSKEWKKKLYESLNLNYPKFYKMDELSKMALLGANLLKSTCDFNKYKDDEISLIFSNKHSSSFTDQKFLASNKIGGTYSPSKFVYTLPNIVSGELSIYMKWFGESIFTIAESIESANFERLIELQFYNEAKACLGGWLEKTENDEWCTLFFIDKNENDSIKKKQITKLISN